MAYVPIHVHTEYSPMDGLSTCAEAVQRAAGNGSPAAAVTDHGGCAGHVDFQVEARKAGIKPIFGIETYFQPDRLLRPGEGDKDAQTGLRSGRHLILLAQGGKGLHDLWAASTEAYATGFYFKPRMDWDLLEEHGGDLIATTSCLGGMVSQDLLAGRFDAAGATLDRMKSVFRDRLYLEIQANELPEQIRLNQMLVLAGEELGIPLVAADDAHYPSEEDAALHKLWMMCQTGKGKEDYWHFSAMLPEDRIREMLGYLDPKTVDEAIRSTAEIAGRCTAQISGHADAPVFTPGGTAADDARRLREMCEANWHRLGSAPGREYRERMEFEFEVVAGKGMAGCYLIVEDIATWVKNQGWLVGPGRGSAAGSLMSYLLDITSIDPMRAGLMFERFLTPGRVSLPDFDLDFASSKRTAIQDYAIRKYGADRVVRVGTVMRYGAKGILNKLFSVLGDRLPSGAEADAKQVANLIDEAEAGTAGLGLPWDEIMSEQAIAEFAKKYAVVFQVAEALHGRLYAVGQHPAGLIISPGMALAGTMPMRIADTSKNKGLLVSQFDFRFADEFGYLKLDFLTLRNLDSVQQCLDMIEHRTGQRLDLRSWDAELGDPQVYDDIGTGDTLGVFQLETSLCRDYCRRMRPRTIADLSDLTTYIRPGPRNSGATEQYLARRAGLAPVEVLHPDLAGHLARSQGVMLYQEDVLYACKVLGGYDDLEADGVRKILGKKLTDKIASAGEEFTRRCVARGHDEEQIRALWDKMAEFGKYAFNRAHGYSYATLSYWCVGGQTRIYDWDKQQYISIAKAYREGIDATACYDPETGKTIRGRVSAVVRTTGAKNKDLKFGWRLTTASRKKLTCSERHLILTPDGYKRLEEIEVGDLVAAEKRHSQSGQEDVRQAIAEGVRRSWAASTEESRREQVRHLSEPAARESRLASWHARYGQKTPEEKYERVRPFIEAAAKSAGRLGTAPCGAVTHSPDEGTVCQWLTDNEIAHEHQVPLPSGKIADFRIKGVFVEILSLAWERPDEYWAQKYGDEPYVLTEAVHYKDDLHWVLEEEPMRNGADVVWDRVISIEPVGDMVMYDIIMEGEPHNFLANGIVVHNTAWLKTHYPVEMTAAILSTIGDMDRMAAFATEARRMGISVLPPDVRFSGAGFQAGPLSVRYGLSAIPKVGPQAIARITAGQPYSTLEDFRRRSGVNAGVLYVLARAGALDALVPSRKGLIRTIERERDGSAVRCVHKEDGPVLGAPNGLPCTYDWDSEPQPPPRIGKKGKPLKVIVKPPPERCTVACRRYTPPPSADLAGYGEYRPAELFREDTEIYGCWMHDAPFAQLDELAPGMRDQARHVALMLHGAPEGSYPLAAVYGGAHTARTRTGNTMWWVSLVTEVSQVELACFSPRRDDEADVPALLRSLRAGTLVSAEVVKRGYTVPGRGYRTGWRLADIWPVAT